MARTRNAVETKTLKISTTPWVAETLDVLAKTGRFGKAASEVAEELLRAKLREVELEGWLTKSHAPARPAQRRNGRGAAR